MVLQRKTAAKTPEAKSEETFSTEPTKEAVKAPTKEVAVKKKAAPPAAVDNQVVPTIQELADVMDPLEFGNIFTRIKGQNGAILTADGETNFGEYVDVQIMSHNDRWFITPDTKEKSARKLCRASYDNKFIVDSESGEEILIEDYTDSIDKYDFKKGKYKDIFAIIVNAEKSAEEGEAIGMVQISVSPTAVKTFVSFYTQAKLSVMRGAMQASHQNCMRVYAISKNTTDGDGYTIMGFKPVPVEVTETFTPVIG